MRHFCRSAPLIAGVLLTAALPAAAQDMQNDDVSAEDIATQPLRDFNLHNDDIPPLLIDVAADPYSAQGLNRCVDIERAVVDLDLYLGPDIDMPAVRKSDMQNGANMAGNVAKSLLGGFIPFRGVVREVSGANSEQKRFERIVGAALIRRGFLKGLGLARGCDWPARPAAEGHVFDPVAHRSRELQRNNSPAPIADKNKPARSDD
ncbi:hypothetical protein RM533_01610 [Croceicoccus sp. F390]|uniref:Uncharacterized protein n=1 Tax=Croceicoccus esteveae TaxID=3075597 RepID=A0ABU2ZET5_9SPHN|nr:hypothetical protein [Croceicoccus sp. F390]MDT0574876.1 hypothetical protein [Croceicoccus sp. F390]